MSRRTSRAAASARHPAPVFAALGDETRLSIVSQLCSGTPRSISQLTEGSKITRQGITKHLRLLENAGVVSSEKNGRESLFKIERNSIDAAQEYLKKISNQWDDSLARLKAFVEN